MRLLFSVFLAIFWSVFLNGQSLDVRQYIFGHSLIDHRPPQIPTPSDETTVPHWLFLLAQEAGHTYAATGRYGFLNTHAASLPPTPNWGYDIVPGLWDDDFETWADGEVNNVMITAGNFVQGTPPTEPWGENPAEDSYIDLTHTITDWVDGASDSVKFIIYENWPEMNVFGDFPPSSSELEAYYDYTFGDFHDWWLEYHDSLIAQRPSYDIKMVPVGPILMDMFRNTVLEDIPILELYEDGDPHGRASLYFMAAVMTYMAVYEEKAPLSFTVPSIVHPIIQENYEMIVESGWAYLSSFNTPNGESRVFTNPNIVNSHIFLENGAIEIYPNPVKDYLFIDGLTPSYDIRIIDAMGSEVSNLSGTGKIVVNLNDLPTGLFFVRLINNSDSSIYLQKMIKE